MAVKGGIPLRRISQDNAYQCSDMTLLREYAGHWRHSNAARDGIPDRRAAGTGNPATRIGGWEEAKEFSLAAESRRQVTHGPIADGIQVGSH